MSCSSPFEYPSSFDPALHLHSDLQIEQGLPQDYPSHSDDIEAIEQQKQETTLQKTKQGIVIQHRAWQLPEVFRSEEDHAIASPSHARPRLNKSIPSSPPLASMQLVSSPVTYPPTSSPRAEDETPRKKRKLDVPRSPLHAVSANELPKRMGGFLMEDSDDEELNIPAPKRAVPANHHPTAELTPDLTPKQSASTSFEAPISTTLSLPTALTQLGAFNPRPTFESAGLHHADDLSLPEGAQTPFSAKTCSGRNIYIRERCKAAATPYEQIVAARSTAAPGQGRKSYYGIDVHTLIDIANAEIKTAEELSKVAASEVRPSVEVVQELKANGKPKRTLMWTEKYRARKFTDLVGDERTHRSVLKWLKEWDPIVFPGAGRPKPKKRMGLNGLEEERQHRKILLLTGPPGLGKTTLAHVCARQAGYEVQEINASDERSRDVVKGRIKDMVGTENVRGLESKTAGGATVRKAGRPVCVVVDEVDGVTSGSGSGGEGGFISALLDLVNLDQKNSSPITDSGTAVRKKRKGDNFRMLRPIILICNDVYHPSLRPLRQSSMAEITHIKKPTLNLVISRLQSVFEKEGVPCDSDDVRKLCEAAWGVSNHKEGRTGSGTGEGDIRSVMVVAEWVAGRLKACMTSSLQSTERLTRQWIEQNVLNELGHGGGAARSLGRGGVREVVERVFKENAGFPKTMISVQEKGVGSGAIGVAEAAKKKAMERLREMVDASGDHDKVISDCFATYPTQTFQDDTLLSKPNAAYDWLSFHDTISSAVFSCQEWELAPYLSQSVLAFHHLFASPSRAKPSYATNDQTTTTPEADPHPLSTLQAAYHANELHKANRATLSTLQSTLSLPLTRLFRSPEDLATDLVPYALRMLSPAVKPIVVGGSGQDRGTASVRKAAEKDMVQRAVECMAATGVRFEATRVRNEGVSMGGNMVQGGSAGWVYRMEPALDVLGLFETADKGLGGADGKVRYAVRQVLEQEWRRDAKRRDEEARRRRFEAGGGLPEGEWTEEMNAKMERKESVEEKVGKVAPVKRDFFGRVVQEGGGGGRPGSSGRDGAGEKARKRHKRSVSGRGGEAKGRMVWVTFNEGYSNAVRKPVTLDELMRGL